VSYTDIEGVGLNKVYVGVIYGIWHRGGGFNILSYYHTIILYTTYLKGVSGSDGGPCTYTPIYLYTTTNTIYYYIILILYYYTIILLLILYY
jgi:hypothetical protein